MGIVWKTEGWWESPPGGPSPKVGHKIESEQYDDGRIVLDVWIRDVTAPDGAVVEFVRASGERMATLSVAKGKGRVQLDSAAGDMVPQLPPGEVVRAEIDGVVHATAVMEPD